MTLRAAALVVLLLVAGFPSGPAAGTTLLVTEATRRGAYVFQAAGCLGCHTDVKNKGSPLAGGRALKTPFGTFHAPNITPDREFGIGTWTEEDLTRALRQGVAPNGQSYYPAFPYTSFAGMTDADIADLWAYLRIVEPVAEPSREHLLAFPFNLRTLTGIWRALYFAPGEFDAGPTPENAAGEAESWRRGAYLVRVLGHCGECHTPRGVLGAVDNGLMLGGNPAGPDGGPVPNITPQPGSGIGDWSREDIVTYLQMGMDPAGDFAGGAMAEVVENTTSRLTPDDRQAIALYLSTLPPVERKIVRQPR